MTVDTEAIRERLAAATPGPWEADTSDCTMNDRNQWGIRRGRNPGENPAHLRSVMSTPDADPIAHAPADLAALCDEMEELTADLYELRQQRREADEVAR